MKSPTVFALMPTLDHREEMRQKALHTFYQQQYPKDWDVNILMDADPNMTLGAKINRMMDDISNLPADYIILVDDDDLAHPTRLVRQVQPLIDNPKLTMSGTSKIVYQEICTKEVFRYSGSAGTWIGGLAFSVSAWRSHRFEDVGAGCDTKWQKNFPLESRLDLQDESLMLCGIHYDNTSKKHTVGREWQRLPDVPDLLMGLL